MDDQNHDGVHLVWRAWTEADQIAKWWGPNHGEDNDAHSSSFRSTVTFVAEGRKTKVTMRALFASAEARAATLKYGAIEGGEQTLARLDQHVATMSPVS
jgi:uncharacterized protein YndB with AHSA1/START domain